jgi:hypothetical protein
MKKITFNYSRMTLVMLAYLAMVIIIPTQLNASEDIPVTPTIDTAQNLDSFGHIRTNIINRVVEVVNLLKDGAKTSLTDGTADLDIQSITAAEFIGTDTYLTTNYVASLTWNAEDKVWETTETTESADE